MFHAVDPPIHPGLLFPRVLQRAGIQSVKAALINKTGYQRFCVFVIAGNRQCYTRGGGAGVAEAIREPAKMLFAGSMFDRSDQLR